MRYLPESTSSFSKELRIYVESMQEGVQAHCIQSGALSVFFGDASLGPGLQMSCSAGVR